ncbi:unnamed protein product [Amoebophrya sp. A120]|nr:unnamed protein product [Amoebophrya sp. A120]|eukprot:GSA120T00021410001.1
MTSIRPPKPGCFLFTSESVNEGHPDKICDQVSDAVLDACLSQDPDARVACETSTKTGMVMVFGEITTKANVDYEAVVRETCRNIGYDSADKGLDYASMDVLNKLEEQSPDIGQGVHGMGTKAVEDIGAGDQGHMFGYASDETPELMPFTHSMSTRLGWQLTKVRKDGTCPWIRPDGKTQVTAEYKRLKDGSMVPQRVHTILISTQHAPDVDNEKIKKDIMEYVIKPILPENLLDADTIYHINPSGRFVIGGPHGDAGLTGRKIIIDTYGGWGAHGGGAFSGKDTTKVDRSAAYAARWAAKSLVANGFARRALVQVSYAIGVVQPLSMFVDTYGSARFGFTDEQLCEIVKRNFDFRPGCIQRDLNLKEPQFTKLAAYGHFGREDCSPAWEVVKDLSHELGAGLCQGKILGMGNPLLDMSNTVEPSVLTEYGLEANNAVLAEDKHKPLYETLDKMPNTDYIPGGATQNSIRTAQWCLKNDKKDSGTSFASYMGCVGKDGYSEKMKAICTKEGVTATYMEDPSVPTGTCAVLITGENRSLVANLSAANNYKHEHLKANYGVLEAASVVYSAGFFITVCPDAMYDASQHCLDNNKTYCLNLSAPFIMEVPPFWEVVTKLLPKVDFLFGNETEAGVFAKVKGWTETDVAEIACKISMLPSEKAKSRTVVITQGADATIVAKDGKANLYPIEKLSKEQIVDTNGAGDAYVGGFLSKLVQGCSVELCCRAGAKAAAVIVQQSGCTFP